MKLMRGLPLEHYGEGAGNPGVPDAPLRDTWHEAVLKRMLRHAAENGYDRLAWTIGDQQAARYDLSKQVSRVEYLPNEKYLRVFDTDGHFIFDKQVEPENIADFVGKEPARRLLAATPETRGAQPSLSIEGDGLKVGGDWARALYDRSLVNFANRYTRKWERRSGQPNWTQRRLGHSDMKFSTRRATSTTLSEIKPGLTKLCVDTKRAIAVPENGPCGTLARLRKFTAST